MQLSGFPYKLTFGLALTIAIDTVVQLAWKTAAQGLPETPSWDVVGAVFGQPLFLLVGALMFCQLFNWLSVLGQADLSFAQPFTSLSRITVCLASVYVLQEHLAWQQVAGIAMVFVGTWCISRTPRMSGANSNVGGSGAP